MCGHGMGWHGMVSWNDGGSGCWLGGGWHCGDMMSETGRDGRQDGVGGWIGRGWGSDVAGEGNDFMR